MVLADRGGASGLVGQRWADVCAEAADTWEGRQIPVPDGKKGTLRVERVVRLDHEPRIASVASKRGLQNPDLLIFGTRDGQPALLAADAKFSIETARSKQVSPEAIEGLLSLGDVIRPMVGEVPGGVQFLPGIFLSPACPLTELMLQGKQGIVRATVEPNEVIMVPVEAEAFFGTLEGASLMPALAAIDALPVSHQSSLLAGLYYFRLARAAAGCWLDSVRPLLGSDDPIALDEAAVHRELLSRAASAPSAFDLILQWDADVELVRNQRVAVEHVGGLRVISRELRQWIETTAAALGEAPPSTNQVRRRLGAWYRTKLREAVGPLVPPVENFGDRLQEIGAAAAKLAPQLEPQTKRIVRELIAARTESSCDVSGGDA